MALSLDLPTPPDSLKSLPQKIRICSENWAAENVSCPCCGKAYKLDKFSNNHKASDFQCKNCGELFQLKAGKKLQPGLIVDGAFHSMCEAFDRREVPSLLLLTYADWKVKQLLCLPGFLFPKSAIIKRKPLSVTAQRAGWVGCNLDLRNIPLNMFIPIVCDATFLPYERIVQNYSALNSLKDDSKKSGWIVEIFKIVGTLPYQFQTRDVYHFEDALRAIFPDNQHIEEKIRQQLQILRDRGMLRQATRGCWSKTDLFDEHIALQTDISGVQINNN